MDLNTLLVDYKNITLELIESISDIEKVEDLMIKRQQIIDDINLNSFDKTKFKEVADNLNLLEIENDLINKMKKENVTAKKALENIRRLKKARSIYNRGEEKPVFFNMKSY